LKQGRVLALLFFEERRLASDPISTGDPTECPYSYDYEFMKMKKKIVFGKQGR
jgi:hypothetical protein